MQYLVPWVKEVPESIETHTEDLHHSWHYKRMRAYTGKLVVHGNSTELNLSPCNTLWTKILKSQAGNISIVDETVQNNSLSFLYIHI